MFKKDYYYQKLFKKIRPSYFIFLLLFLSLILKISSTSIFAKSDIIIKGSPVILPIAQECANLFLKENPKVDIYVREGGSELAISSLIEKTCDIANSDRPMQNYEIKEAIINGIDPKGVIIAMDAIAVIVNPSNPVSALTRQEIKDIYQGKISNWNKIGGEKDKIVVISQDSSSNIFDVFSELALNKEKIREDILLHSSNEAVVTTVAKMPAAIGYIWLKYINDNVKVLSIDRIGLAKKTVLSAEYPLCRPLYMYTDGSPKGVVKNYIDFLFSKNGQNIIEKNGYISLY